MKRVLIIGASGFLGKKIASAMGRGEYEIFGTGHGDAGGDMLAALGGAVLVTGRPSWCQRVICFSTSLLG